MTRNIRTAILLLCLFLAASISFAQQPPQMKFSEVREVAPGVFFRFAAVSATDKSIFGGCNNVWVVFKDYVLVYDANFPKEAGDVIKAVRKTTNKPIRYVLDSHHHGDHAYGNAVWAKAGASIIAQANCNHWLRTRGPDEFFKAGKGPTGRKDIANSTLKIPDIVFDDKLVLDDGTQRAVLIHFGHCHTPGDAGLYLPKYQILCTGDACVNGAFNYTGHSNTATWVKNLEKMQQFKIKLLLPGHGQPETSRLISKQRRYFVELRAQVKNGIDNGKDLEDIKKSINIPWYKGWTGVDAKDRIENIQHVYDEFTGRILDWNLAEDYGIYQAISPTKKTPGWKKPSRIIVPNLDPAKLAELKRIAPDVFFVPVRTAKEAGIEAADADAVLGFCTKDIIAKGKRLRWLQIGPRGVEEGAAKGLADAPIAVTDVRHISGTDVAEQAFALMLSLTRRLRSNGPKTGNTVPVRATAGPRELAGRTMLVVGLGSIGKQISKRAHAFGMRVAAIDANANQEKPAYVFSLHDYGKLMKLLPQADVVVLACPMTLQTKTLLSTKQFKAMKKAVVLINVARSGLVDTKALTVALQNNEIAGAGLDVTDPGWLPQKHALRNHPHVIITPQRGGASPAARDRQWKLWRENIRRFVQGEPLLCVVER